MIEYGFLQSGVWIGVNLGTPITKSVLRGIVDNPPKWALIDPTTFVDSLYLSDSFSLRAKELRAVVRGRTLEAFDFCGFTDLLGMFRRWGDDGVGLWDLEKYCSIVVGDCKLDNIQRNYTYKDSNVYRATFEGYTVNFAICHSGLSRFYYVRFF